MSQNGGRWRHYVRPQGAIALALGILALDQLTKWVVVLRLAPGESVAVVGEIVRLTRVHNPGGAFGLLPQHVSVLSAVAVVVTVATTWVLLTARPSWASRPGLGLLWAGTVGNLIDRLRWGYVLDFVQVPHWPVFNVADSAIVLGVALIAWSTVRRAR